MNASDNYLLAKTLHGEIEKITEQHVKYELALRGQSAAHFERAS